MTTTTFTADEIQAIQARRKFADSPMPDAFNAPAAEVSCAEFLAADKAYVRRIARLDDTTAFELLVLWEAAADSRDGGHQFFLQRQIQVLRDELAYVTAGARGELGSTGAIRYALQSSINERTGELWRHIEAVAQAQWERAGFPDC
ncbi:MAG TPA: hypothetical protein VIP27_10260 [Variovorax sp.]